MWNRIRGGGSENNTPHSTHDQQISLNTAWGEKSSHANYIQEIEFCGKSWTQIRPGILLDTVFAFWVIFLRKYPPPPRQQTFQGVCISVKKLERKFNELYESFYTYFDNLLYINSHTSSTPAELYETSHIIYFRIIPYTSSLDNCLVCFLYLMAYQPL